MSFRSTAVKNMVARIAGAMTLAVAALVSVSLTNESFIRAQSSRSVARPNWRLPDESTGIDGIAQTLISAFDQADIVALGERHTRKLDSDIRIAMVRHPDFAKKVGSVVVECASMSEQPTLDRYIRGENVSKGQLERVWKTGTIRETHGFCDAPVYADFLAAVRDINSKLPAAARIRVFGGDPGPGDNRGRVVGAISVLKDQALPRHGKALVIYGSAHFYLTGPADYHASMPGNIGFAGMLDIEYPGRWLSVIPVGGIDRPPALKEADVEPDYQKVDRGLKTRERPVLVSLQRLPFGNFTAEEFLGRTLVTCRPPGGCRSVFKGSNLLLREMADACVFFGDADVDTKAKSAR